MISLRNQSQFQKLDLDIKNTVIKKILEKGFAELLCNNNFKNEINETIISTVINDSFCKLSSDNVLIMNKHIQKTILGSIGDSHKHYILSTIQNNPKTIYEIKNKNVDIPTSTIYHKTRDLFKDGLIFTHSLKNNENKPVYRYKTSFQEYRCFLENGMTVIHLTLDSALLENPIVQKLQTCKHNYKNL